MTRYTELTKETREIVRVTYADGASCRYIGDANGTKRIFAYDECGNGDWEPWICCEDSSSGTLMRAPARHFIIEYEADQAVKFKHTKEIAF